ncbi:hypothetical protein EON63_06555 [archaeon]|nr:MAG: hypothetical protein EON63_06555 [archaeon]
MYDVCLFACVCVCPCVYLPCSNHLLTMFSDCLLQSFSGMGGYIAASKEVIAYLKTTSPGLLYHNSMSPIICQQILTAFRVIQGQDGTDIGQRKLTALRDNCNYFRSEMKKLGELCLCLISVHFLPYTILLCLFICRAACLRRPGLAHHPCSLLSARQDRRLLAGVRQER